MPAAFAIPALISAGGAVATGAIGAHAAHSAAKTQAKSGQQALDLQKQIYGQQMAGMQPYANVGGAANSTMGRLMGAPPGAQFASQGPPPSPLAQAMQAPGVQQAQPRGLFASALSRAQGPQGQPPPMGGPQGPPQLGQPPMGGNGGMVTLRAPNGSVGQVPAHLAEQFLARGAQRVA